MRKAKLILVLALAFLGFGWHYIKCVRVRMVERRCVERVIRIDGKTANAKTVSL